MPEDALRSSALIEIVVNERYVPRGSTSAIVGAPK